MKSIISAGVAWATALAVGAMTPVTDALAADNFHGSICQPQGFVQADNLQYNASGVKAKNSTIVLRCPLVTDGTNITAVRVSVGSLTVPQNTICSVSPVNFTGTLSDAITFVIPPGTRFKEATIPSSAKGLFMAYSVKCDLPAGQTLTTLTVHK